MSLALIITALLILWWLFGADMPAALLVFVLAAITLGGLE